MLLVKIIQLNHLFLSCQKRVGPAFKAGMTSWEYHSSHKLCEPFWEVYFNGNHSTQKHRLKSIINTKINRKTANNGCTTISKNTPNSHTTKEPFGGGFKRTYLIEGAGLWVAIHKKGFEKHELKNRRYGTAT
jgi:hypothetical protein